MPEADSNTGYAYWTSPENGFTVTYSLAVFHEIDFQVSEGFRRVPHGGIETGGLLFGRIEQNGSQLSARIEASRLIECEHASGPSFNLSERDVAGIREQLTAAGSDSELQGLEPVGWYIAHTRSPLQMNDREAALFGQLFPGPGRMLVLVKPERFQATRFAFIMRGADGAFERDGAARAIILPLPGRADRAGERPAASIPAPARNVQPEAPTSTPPESPAKPPATSPAAAMGSRPLPPPREVPVASTRDSASESSAPEKPALSFWRDVPAQGARPEPVVRISEPEPSPEVAEPTALALREPGEVAQRRSELRSGELEAGRDAQQRITRQMRRQSRLSALRMAALLVLAAALGCGVGYFAYLQLPSATIPLVVQKTAATPPSVSGGQPIPTVIVSWPPDETNDAIAALIRVNDGDPIQLSLQQKVTGRISLPVTSDNVKIELIAQRRWRDSRGIVRYVRAKPESP